MLLWMRSTVEQIVSKQIFRHAIRGNSGGYDQKARAAGQMKVTAFARQA
jgi:hypothetical protein